MQLLVLIVSSCIWIATIWSYILSILLSIDAYGTKRVGRMASNIRAFLLISSVPFRLPTLIAIMIKCLRFKIIWRPSLLIFGAVRNKFVKFRFVQSFPHL